MKCFVTGGAGFIGSHLVDRLLREGHSVTVYDNFCTGFKHFLDGQKTNRELTIINADLLKRNDVITAMNGHDMVFHFAANADVRTGLEHPARDLNQNTIATFNVLEGMRENDIKKIAFSSSSAVYGNPKIVPTPEGVGFPIQTSLYGASKLACEGLVEAYCEGYNMQSWIFRYVSVLGERYSHGHVFDFYKQLQEHPEYLSVLGDGRQRKSYIYVKDCISAIMLIIESTYQPVNIFNIGNKEYCNVRESVHWICEHLKITPEVRYGESKIGWIGDNPFVFLDTTKIETLGWKPELSIKESIIKTLDYFETDTSVLQRG